MDKDLTIAIYHSFHILKNLKKEVALSLLNAYIDEETTDIEDKENFKAQVANSPIGLLSEMINEALNFYIKKFEINKIFKLITINGIEHKVFIALC